MERGDFYSPSSQQKIREYNKIKAKEKEKFQILSQGFFFNFNIFKNKMGGIIDSTHSFHLKF